MGTRDDKLVAIIGLLAACLISVVFLFTLTWLADVRHTLASSPDIHSCQPAKHPPPAHHS